MEPVLDLITSYESRIATVEELMTTAYQATVTSDGSFDTLDEERGRLKTGLQKTLAKNCSLRRKDFNRLIDRILSDAERKKEEIEEERKRVREELKEYLNRQRELAASLREKVIQFTVDAEKDNLKATIEELKSTVHDEERIFAILRNFQLRLEVFQTEQKEMNNKLQRLLERGESLRIEDLRQLEAVKAHQDRKATRESRREEVERLLLHFKQQRQGSTPYGR